jgi:glycosyltransferase involved in cell wall biosynthesis
MKLSVVTVFKFGDTAELDSTVTSVRRQNVRPYEHIIVISGAQDPGQTECRYKNEYTRLIINRDRSLYNGMNLGMSAASGDAIIFINGGDELIGDYAIEALISRVPNSRCLAFRAIQYYKNDGYVRPSIARIGDLRTHPSHQAFVAPLAIARQIPFNEAKSISADSDWMRKLIALCGVDIDESVLSRFSLGGISNRPTPRTVKLRFRESGLRRGLLEGLKMCARYLLGERRYYRVLLSYKCDRQAL